MISGTVASLAVKKNTDATLRQGGPHNANVNAWGDRAPSNLRGHIAPWSTSPAAPSLLKVFPKPHDNVVTFSANSTAETDLPSWQNRTGHLPPSSHANLSLRGQPNPNYTTTLTRGTKGQPGQALSSSMYHGPDVHKTPFNNWSTARNDRDSWEVRAKGSARGQDAPWNSLRTYSGPAGDSSTGVLQQHGHTMPLTNTSTAATDVASWTTRVQGGVDVTSSTGGLRGSKNPNAHMRLGSVCCTGSEGTLAAAPDVPFTDSSTASTDPTSWRKRVVPAGDQLNSLTRGIRGQDNPYAQTLTESTASAGNTAALGKTYQRHGGKQVTSSSTATVDTASWENRVNQAHDLPFRSTRGQQQLSTYFNTSTGRTV